MILIKIIELTVISKESLDCSGAFYNVLGSLVVHCDVEDFGENRVLFMQFLLGVDSWMVFLIF